MKPTTVREDLKQYGIDGSGYGLDTCSRLLNVIKKMEAGIKLDYNTRQMLTRFDDVIVKMELVELAKRDRNIAIQLRLLLKHEEVYLRFIEKYARKD